MGPRTSPFAVAVAMLRKVAGDKLDQNARPTFLQMDYTTQHREKGTAADNGNEPRRVRPGIPEPPPPTCQGAAYWCGVHGTSMC